MEQGAGSRNSHVTDVGAPRTTHSDKPEQTLVECEVGPRQKLLSTTDSLMPTLTDRFGGPDDNHFLFKPRQHRVFISGKGLIGH